MTVSLNTTGSNASPAVCRLLRTKVAFGGHELDGEPATWQTGQSTTAVFWCLKTMATAGPDDQFAHPSACQPGRCCYRADD